MTEFYLAGMLRQIESIQRLPNFDVSIMCITPQKGIQLRYVKALIRLSHTSELEQSLCTLVRRETGILHNVLLPGSRVALSVWLLLTPLAYHLPSYSKLKATVETATADPRFDRPSANLDCF